MTDGSTEFLPPIGLDQIKELLPHRYPMLLVDKIVDVSPNDTAVGIKCVTVNEPFFQGHFPEMAVMPGVLIVEAMAQTAAAYTAFIDKIETDNKIVLFMGVDKAKFRRPVIPGDQMRIEVAITQRRAPVWKYEAKAKVDGKVVAEAQFAAMLTEPRKGS